VIISLNSINQLIFAVVKYCVFFAVQTEFLNIIQASFGFKGLNHSTTILHIYQRVGKKCVAFIILYIINYLPTHLLMTFYYFSAWKYYMCKGYGYFEIKVHLKFRWSLSPRLYVMYRNGVWPFFIFAGFIKLRWRKELCWRWYQPDRGRLLRPSPCTRWAKAIWL
jgi:hypothetical protein